jgi:hypothetical protein
MEKGGLKIVFNKETKNKALLPINAIQCHLSYREKRLILTCLEK